MLGLSTLKSYGLGILASIVGFLTIRNKFLSHKNEKLEHDALIIDEIKAIHEQQEEDAVENKKESTERLKAKNEKTDSADTIDLNSL